MKMNKWSTEEGYKSFNDTFYFVKGLYNNPFLNINNGNKKNRTKYVEVIYNNDYLSLSETLHKQEIKLFIVSSFEDKKISKYVSNNNIETHV